ncbi:TPA: hypothetical protein DEQ22_03025 [Candidatus Nomurabacteria bacterium]|uniref:Uncharacterized protein n=2 Tax=Candidatus Nomuraibacteriota TaxID=1752729 RepID=A0A1F6YP95_9BACT|nr:MAG: hypothetical protein UV13_C0011G0013 [Parcubacteria group bacterium GW2011_GWC1_42_21]KKT10685.1 MAG: hypothetical protein UV91_C0011G0021 [Candidatus Nomurabacteria bacterium GW2011_GWF2_43_24]OGI74882.1 MAG: hypothetical protein A2740_02590 [Candidatus Nomurabacteria bacterium RIFCSPHIGHO2_01_FULL_43_16]OGI97229.1 MAG: hypothetical protein A3A11_00725 [Candidatus Nomurabacteria bacterium RIFCSPLOWO2_01_FULL_43_15]OGJ05034.1 MAG: hypothetical protein A2357_03135 [Candidatus Nomurabacte
MYLLLTLFFISLAGIIFMVGKKLVMFQNGQLSREKKVLSEIQYLEEWKHLTVKNIKRHGYVALVTIIRFYVQSSNLLKNKYQEAKIKIKNMRDKKLNGNPAQKQEISNFLKIISEYKHKIRQIKHRIKEEESNH